jgi:hypothetical protein
MSSAHVGATTLIFPLWQTYVIPRNLYGIEVLNYTKTDIIKFERLQFKYAAKYRVIPIGQQMPLSIFYLDLNQYSMLLTKNFIVDFPDFSFSHFSSQYVCIASLTVIFHSCFVGTVSSNSSGLGSLCSQIQGHPNRTANAAVYILLGLEPIQSVVDKLLLTFFGCIIQDEDSIEYRIVERQPIETSRYINVCLPELGGYYWRHSFSCMEPWS